MSNSIPAYIENRIRRPQPNACCVVAGSSPVVSFGDATAATVATLGLNPSCREFLDKRGVELVGAERRLATLNSLGTDDLQNAPIGVIAQVLDECNSYFGPNAYGDWFGKLEEILGNIGASYYDGSACHLDVVQWATDPTWGKLKPAGLRRWLAAQDGEFLIEQLRNENFEILLVNGSGVMKQLERLVECDWDEYEPIVGLRRHDTQIFGATILGRINVIAWSTNLQSSFGVTNELRQELAERVEELA